MGGEVKRQILAVHLDGDEVCILAREHTDDRVSVEYMKHVLHTPFCAVQRIVLEGHRLRVLENRLDFTALEREVYATTKVYVDKILSEEETKDLYDTLTNYLQYPGDFTYLFNRLTK